MFDGIGTGLHILKDKLGLHVDAYYSSEIDANAIKVQKYNFFGDMVRLGCISKCTNEMLHALGPIDLLIGGSPCNELSRVNFRRKGLFGNKLLNALFQSTERHPFFCEICFCLQILPHLDICFTTFFG